MFILYSATYPDRQNKRIPIAVRSLVLNSRFGDHNYANVQAMYLKSMGSQVAVHSVSHIWFLGNEQIHFTPTWNEIQFREAWPQCSTGSAQGSTVQRILEDGFFIKRFLWPGQAGSTGHGTEFTRAGTRVDFLASTGNIPETNSPRNLEIAFRDQAMISKSSCQAGQLTGVLTKRRTLVGESRRALSFRQCGFASLLSYFCFLDGSHLPSRSGYQLLANQGGQNPWSNGNMPNLRYAPINFNNNRCKIIYVINHYRIQHRVNHLSPNERGPQKGSKAILYAAYASGYTEMVAYKNPPCHTTDPNCPCPSVGSDGNVQMGNTFNVGDILFGFNRLMNPRLQPGQHGYDASADMELIHFDRHFGNQWFFCQRRSRRQ